MIRGSFSPHFQRLNQEVICMTSWFFWSGPDFVPAPPHLPREHRRTFPASMDLYLPGAYDNIC